MFLCAYCRQRARCRKEHDGTWPKQGEGVSFRADVDNVCGGGTTKLVCLDMKLNGNVVGQLVIKKDPPRTATIVQNCVVLCDDSPLTITGASPLTAEFDCGGTTVEIVKQGGMLTWSAGPFNGDLCIVP